MPRLSIVDHFHHVDLRWIVGGALDEIPIKTGFVVIVVRVGVANSRQSIAQVQHLHPVENRISLQPGDSVIGIAEEFGIDPTELADFNNLADWNSIQPGQILYIPEPGSTPLPLETPEE